MKQRHLLLLVAVTNQMIHRVQCAIKGARDSFALVGCCWVLPDLFAVHLFTSVGTVPALPSIHSRLACNLPNLMGTKMNLTVSKMGGRHGSSQLPGTFGMATT
jgi:hypothetical protein